MSAFGLRWPMPIDQLSSNTSDEFLRQILESKHLSAAGKAALSKGGAGSAGNKDVFDAANKVLAGDGKSLDSFDVDHDGQLSGSERDAAVDALVALLSNPTTAQAFLSSLKGKEQADDAKATAISQSSTNRATQPSSAGGPTGPGNPGGPASSAGAGAGASGPSQTANPTGQAAQGGASQASEFGSEKQVDPTKNFKTVPGGGYSVDDATGDIIKLAASDTRERGPQPTPEQAKQLAQGIINGVNNYFDKSTNPKETAQALIASAWKESKFNFNAPNGGVFQTAQNRFDDYQKAHPGSTLTHDQLSTTGNPAAAIDVSLWAIAHPVAGLGQPAGVSTPVPADGSPTKALYFWNYNSRSLGNGSTELDDYIDKTNYFRGLLT